MFCCIYSYVFFASVSPNICNDSYFFNVYFIRSLKNNYLLAKVRLTLSSLTKGYKRHFWTSHGHGFVQLRDALSTLKNKVNPSSIFTTLNIPIIEGGTNSSHTHNLAKSQSHQRLKLLRSGTKFMTTVISMLIYHRFQGN